MPLAPPPTAISLLVSDNMVVDSNTGQLSILGILAHIHAPRFPVYVPRLFIYAELTNGRGRVEVGARIVDVNEQKPPIFDALTEVTFADPLAIAQLSMMLTDVLFPQPGEYRVQIRTQTHLLLERRLVLIPVTPTDHPPTPQPEQRPHE